MRIKSIFSKFLIPTVLIVCLFALTVLTVTRNLFTEAFEQQIYSQNSDTSSFIAQSVQSFMDKAYKISDELAHDASILSMQTDLQTPVVQGAASRNDYFELIYIQDMNGDQTGRSSGTLSNRANRWWFIQMMQTHRPFVSKSYYSVNTNMACASIFIPLESNNQMIGVLATDIKLTTLQSLVEEFSEPEKGKISFIIDGEGVVIAHPESVYYEELYNYKNLTRTVTKQDAAGKTQYDSAGNIVTEELPIEISEEYADVISNVMSGQSGSTKISDNNKTYYVSYAPVALNGYSDSWSVITLQEQDIAMQVTKRINNIGAAVTLVAIIIAILLIALITRTITTPIKQCLNRLKQLAHGDLTTQVPAAAGHDETAQLLDTLNITIHNLNAMVQKITQYVKVIETGDFTQEIDGSFSGDFNVLTTSLSSFSAAIRMTLQNINQYCNALIVNINHLDAGARMLSDDTSNQASAIEQLSATLTDISEKVSANAENSRESSMQMGDVHQNVITSTTNLSALVDAMKTIETNSNEINGISRMIQMIASQTNLLSMNASVEASRAGEAGKGFAVVAAEIRRLAAQCTQAAQSTADLIEKTQQDIHDGISILNKTVDSMEVVSSVGAVASQHIQDISAATVEQAESITQITKAVEQISGVTQNNSANAAESAQISNQMKQQVMTLGETLNQYRY